MSAAAVAAIAATVCMPTCLLCEPAPQCGAACAGGTRTCLSHPHLRATASAFLSCAAFAQHERQALTRQLRDADITAAARQAAEAKVAELQDAISGMKQRTERVMAELQRQKWVRCLPEAGGSMSCTVSCAKRIV